MAQSTQDSSTNGGGNDDENESLTDDERENIIRDILRWRLELDMNDGGVEQEEWDHYIDDLETCSDSELIKWWNSTVGEWVASRSDLDIPEDVTFGEWIDEQFDRLKEGEETGYGYVVSVHYP